VPDAVAVPVTVLKDEAVCERDCEPVPVAEALRDIEPVDVAVLEGVPLTVQYGVMLTGSDTVGDGVPTPAASTANSASAAAAFREACTGP